MAERIRTCIICGNNSSTLHVLPNKKEQRKRWLEFIFGRAPVYYSAWLVVCSDHFEPSDFTNYGAYSSGFVSKLSLKPGSVPSRRSTTSSQANTSHTLMPPPLSTDPPTQLPMVTVKEEAEEEIPTSLCVGDKCYTVDLGSPSEFIVDEECLLELFKSCRKCNQRCIVQKDVDGLKIVVVQSCGVCLSRFEWTNLPDEDRQPDS
uniref:THAP-type domain-containing protein n=2 Tax=Iconisemion striatum TaxID=60296 RepID=A0A1A7W8Q9_9TELE